MAPSDTTVGSRALCERRLVAAINPLQLQQSPHRKLAQLEQLEQLGFDGGEQVRAELASQIAFQQPIARVAVLEPRTILYECRGRHFCGPVAFSVDSSSGVYSSSQDACAAPRFQQRLCQLREDF